jgi:hypothetical protein
MWPGLSRRRLIFVSDEALWKKRVTERVDALQNPDVATWERIQHQRQWFVPWQEGAGLFVDVLNPVDQNYARVLEFVIKPEVALEPLQVDVSLSKGHYHE